MFNFGNTFRTNPLITNTFIPATPTFRTITGGSFYGGTNLVIGAGDTSALSGSIGIASNPSPFSDFITGFMNAFLSFF